MWKYVQNAVTLLLLMTALTGLVYPLALTGIAQTVFPYQANGSLIEKNGVPVGSDLIGQNFSADGYFHSRPSVAGSDGYDASASSGSNLGPTSTKLIDTIKERVAAVREKNSLGPHAMIPSDMVTASASGLDPHISLEAAYMQAQRVAQTRNISVTAVYSIIDKHIEGRKWGLFGEQRVNVLRLNLTLDSLN